MKRLARQFAFIAKNGLLTGSILIFLMVAPAAAQPNFTADGTTGCGECHYWQTLDEYNEMLEEMDSEGSPGLNEIETQRVQADQAKPSTKNIIIVLAAIACIIGFVAAMWLWRRRKRIP